jgi:dihydroxy-acid dehydratase
MADHGGESNIPAIPGHDPKSSPDYVQFKCLPPGGPLNRWSTTLTRGHDFPGAQVCNQFCIGVAERTCR